MADDVKAQKNGSMFEMLLKAAGAFGSVAAGNGLPAPDEIKIGGKRDLPEGTLVGSAQTTPAVEPETVNRGVPGRK